MKSRFLVPAVVVMLAFVAPSCGGDGRTQPNPAPSICFTVSGFNVTVANIWTGGAGHNVNVQGLVAFDGPPRLPARATLCSGRTFRITTRRLRSSASTCGLTARTTAIPQIGAPRGKFRGRFRAGGARRSAGARKTCSFRREVRQGGELESPPASCYLPPGPRRGPDGRGSGCHSWTDGRAQQCMLLSTQTEHHHGITRDDGNFLVTIVQVGHRRHLQGRTQSIFPYYVAILGVKAN